MNDDRIKVNPYLSVAPTLIDDELTLVIETVESRETFEVNDFELLDVCDRASDWIDRHELLTYVSENFEYSEIEADAFLRKLVDNGFLITDESERFDRGTSSDWVDDGWESALFYTTYITDWPFMDYSEDGVTRKVIQRLTDYSAERDPPSCYKTYPGCESIALPDVPDKARIQVELPAPTSSRSIDTDYSVTVTDAGTLGSFASHFECGDESPDATEEATEPLELETLSNVLFYVFGEIGWVESYPHERLILRTSPGHGGLHPTEAYVIASEVADVPAGVYHYSVRDHSLERVRSSIPHDTPQWDESARCTVVLTAVVARSMWKYRASRSVRLLFHDVGHLLETATIVGRALGVDAVPVPSFDRSAVADVLDLDVLEEPPLAAFTCRT